jgi:hypothetical protein
VIHLHGRVKQTEKYKMGYNPSQTVLTTGNRQEAVRPPGGAQGKKRNIIKIRRSSAAE